MQAHLFFVPIYLSSLFIWPVSGFADEPYLGRSRNESKRRGHQGTLLMLEALRYIRGHYPFWNESSGTDHIWMMLHDEGPCLCPREIRSSILLTHYGYHADPPKPWTTWLGDDWLSSTSFYSSYIGDPARPTRCFDPQKDIVLPPWKHPGFWRFGLSKTLISESPHRERTNLVYFAGDLGKKRLTWYSHHLRQIAHALFCNPEESRPAQSKECTPWLNGCRSDLPMNCSKWRPGVVVTEHTKVGWRPRANGHARMPTGSLSPGALSSTRPL